MFEPVDDALETVEIELVEEIELVDEIERVEEVEGAEPVTKFTGGPFTNFRKLDPN